MNRQQIVEVCGCTPDLEPLPFDRDNDGIGEECRRCGCYIILTADPEHTRPVPA